MTTTLQIFAAMRAGAETSVDIAKRARLPRANVSVSLCRLSDLGLVVRSGIVNHGRQGRPCLRWRMRPTAPLDATERGASN